MPFNTDILLVCLVFGIIVAGIVTYFKYRAMKTIALARDATDYLDNGSFDLTYSRDEYLRTSVTRIPCPKNKN